MTKIIYEKDFSGKSMSDGTERKRESNSTVKD